MGRGSSGDATSETNRIAKGAVLKTTVHQNNALTFELLGCWFISFICTTLCSPFSNGRLRLLEIREQHDVRSPLHVANLMTARQQAATALPVAQIQFRVVADTAMHAQNSIERTWTGALMGCPDHSPIC